MTEREEQWRCRVDKCGWAIVRTADFAVELLRDHAWYAHQTCYRCWRRHDPALPCPKPRPVVMR